MINGINKKLAVATITPMGLYQARKPTAPNTLSALKNKNAITNPKEINT
jgi:hypothetical protein